MRTSVIEEIQYRYESLQKRLPARFRPLLDQRMDGRVVTLVVFPDNRSVVTGACVLKACKQIQKPDVLTLFFARCFTLEAQALIGERGGRALALIECPWTDESYHAIYGGRQT